MNKYHSVIGYCLLLPVWAGAQQDAVPSETSRQLLEEQAIYHLPQKGLVQGLHLNGSLHYKGQALRGRLEGTWQSWYANNIPCDAGSFRKGIPDGSWEVWNPNGNPRFVRTYSADKWLRFEQDRLRYHPKRCSSPLAEMEQQDKQKAAYYINVQRSFGVPGSCTGGENNTVLHRLYENSSGEHYHPLFEKGLLHGPFVNYFPDGTVKDSGDYENGLPHGHWLHYLGPAQNHWKGYYHHGEKDKEWKLYDAGGKLLQIIHYKKGKELWRKEMRASSTT